jgi:hypothetical protein
MNEMTRIWGAQDDRVDYIMIVVFTYIDNRQFYAIVSP